MPYLEISSIVSARDQRGYVQIKQDEKVIAQLTPIEAREVAVNLLDCSNAAQADAFLVEFLQQRIGVDFEKAARVLPEFRDFRTREHSRPVDVERTDRPLGKDER